MVNNAIASAGRGADRRRRSIVPTTQHADEQARRNKRARLLTPDFSLVRHLGTFGGLATSGLATAGWLMRHARVRDLWIVPIYLVVANLAEYFFHRVLMHRPLWPRALYRGHTLGHHRAFHHDSMPIDDWHELELVMMPALTIGIFFAGIAPVVALVAWGLGDGVAGLLLLTAIGTFVGYEGLHTLYHLPPGLLQRRGLAGNRAFAWLYSHHRHHHRLSRMRWMNFNISMPLCDRLFGTVEDEQAWLAQREAPPVVESKAS
jgi:hypothetical protein